MNEALSTRPSADLPLAGSPAAVARAGLQGRARAVAAAGMIAVPLVVWLGPWGLEPAAQHGLALMTFVILGWMTHVLDPAIIGLIGLYLAWALGVVPFRVAFAGFSNSTPWFLFGAMLFGTMATKSGLARRLAFTVMRRMGSTYSRLLLGLIVSDFLLTLLVPSGVARVAIMGAVAAGVVEIFGVGRGSRIGRGMFITLTYAATIFDKMVIAGAASITARGVIEHAGEVPVLWSQWALAFLPVDILTIVLAWRLTIRLYPPERERPPGGGGFLTDELQRMGPLSAVEKKSALLLAIAIGLWMTDFLHHIPPPMIGIGIGLLATLPRVGVLDIEDVRRLNFLIIIFVAAAISTGEILRETGALKVLTDSAFGWLEPFIDNPWESIPVLYWTGFVYHIFLGDEISMLATSLPVLMHLARAHGVDPLTLGMIWTFGAGGKIFIYQTAVLVVGYSFGYFTPRDMFKMGLALTVVEFVLLLLIVPFWWPLIGLWR
ncbi:MAG TPA: SLC13 family permease [Vicinamibacterales bacterium]|nr:SLC13 family permease [Vicinamibacterales bacterium]